MENDPGAQALESRPSGAATIDSDLEKSNRLFEAATREWSALAESLHDLKCGLEPGDFAAALAHMKIPGLEKMVRDWRKAQAEYEAVLSSASAGRGESAAAKPATASSDSPRETPETNAEEATQPAPEPEAEPPSASTQPARTNSSETGDGSDETTEIQRQLTELTALLRQHVALTNDQNSSPGVEIPKQLTLKIAREVAGHVKDSVLETLRANEKSREADKTADRQLEKKSEKMSEKVPLEDVAAMIDQLTKF